MSQENVTAEAVSEMSQTDIDDNEQTDLEDLLNNALLDFNKPILTASTQTPTKDRKTKATSIGTNSKVMKFDDDIRIDDDLATENDGQNISYDLEDEMEAMFTDFNNKTNSDINIDYIDKLMNDFQQKMSVVMEETSIPAEFHEAGNITDDSTLFTKEMQTNFCKMAQDTMNSLINQGLTNEEGDCSRKMRPPGSDTNCKPKDFKDVISQAIKNLCENSKELDGGILMNSSDEIAKLINDVTFKDNEHLDEREIEQHFLKIFIDIGQSLLYPPLKEIRDKYPTYLENNKSKLTKEMYDNYEHQYTKMVEICKIFEEDGSERKNDEFQNILNIMKEIQNCGLPPEEVITGNSFSFYNNMVSGFNLNFANEQWNIY